VDDAESPTSLETSRAPPPWREERPRACCTISAVPLTARELNRATLARQLLSPLADREPMVHRRPDGLSAVKLRVLPR
jgi:hypothetical protein